MLAAVPVVPVAAADLLPRGGILPILDLYIEFLDRRIAKDRATLARIRAARAQLGGGRAVETNETDTWRRYA